MLFYKIKKFNLNAGFFKKYAEYFKINIYIK